MPRGHNNCAGIRFTFACHGCAEINEVDKCDALIVPTFRALHDSFGLKISDGPSRSDNLTRGIQQGHRTQLA